jgi:D-erythro-7,8-dihydroneopterin triphosphate epimerase
MHDEIRVDGLHLRTIIGINGDERRDRQDVLISFTLFVDTLVAGRSDNLEDAPVNYRSVTKRVITLVEGSQFYLIERLAAAVADLCLEEPGVGRVRVTVEKPGAIRFARSVGITIERERAGGR